jgi:hypothetical protein
LDTDIISIDGTVCPPTMEPQFQKWYDEWHIPESMKFKGLLGVTRYKFATIGGDATVTEYPGYLAIRRFKDLQAFEAWNASQERQLACQHFDELKAAGVELWWRVQYQCIKRWKNTSPTTLISLTALHCGPEAEAAVDKWYTEKHVPDLLEFKEILGVTRYKLANAGAYGIKTSCPVKVTDYPRFLTIYNYPDMATAQAFDTSPERAAARPDWLEVAKKTKAFRMWRVRYTPLRTWSR